MLMRERKSLEEALEVSERTKQQLRDTVATLEAAKTSAQEKVSVLGAKGKVVDEGRLQLKGLAQEMQMLQQKLEGTIAIQEGARRPSEAMVPPVNIPSPNEPIQDIE
jgi:hypothetical protein